jgi:hypothetical protein
LDVTNELFKHSSDSVDGTSIKEHISFSGGHLGEDGDNGSIVASKLDFDTSLEELSGVGRELNERSFLSNKVVKESDGTLDNRDGTSVLGDSLDVKTMTFLSSGSSGGEGGSVVSEVLDGVGEVNLGLVSGGGASGEMVRSSSEGGVTFVNFVGSESLLFSARSLVSGKHSIMLRLFSSDLVLKIIKKSFDVGKWATSFNLGFDLGEQVAEIIALKCVKFHVVHLE